MFCWRACTNRQFILIYFATFKHQGLNVDTNDRFLLRRGLNVCSICRDFNLEETLEGVGAQVCSELNKSLTERSCPALTPDQQMTLTGQICSISQKNPIRTLVGTESDNRKLFLCLFQSEEKEFLEKKKVFCVKNL